MLVKSHQATRNIYTMRRINCRLCCQCYLTRQDCGFSSSQALLKVTCFVLRFFSDFGKQIPAFVVLPLISLIRSQCLEAADVCTKLRGWLRASIRSLKAPDLQRWSTTLTRALALKRSSLFVRSLLRKPVPPNLYLIGCHDQSV